MAVTPKYTHQIVALVTEPVGQTLRSIAEVEEVSLADVIRDAVTLYLAHRAAESGTPERAASGVLVQDLGPEDGPPEADTRRIRRVQEILNTRR